MSRFKRSAKIRISLNPGAGRLPCSIRERRVKSIPVLAATSRRLNPASTLALLIISPKRAFPMAGV
jgi:hypothetical protein